MNDDYVVVLSTFSINPMTLHMCVSYFSKTIRKSKISINDLQYFVLFCTYQMCLFIGHRGLNDKKRVSKWMSLCYTVIYKWVTVMVGIKFEFNDIVISL